MSSELQIVEKLLPKYFRVSTPIVTVNQYRKLSWHELNGDASQIASALTNLEPNHLTLIGAFVTRLFPEIELLKFGPTDNSGFVEIFVRDRGRDLALSKVGAGIAQAIVLLYATLFAPKDAIVLFDEAFEHLHPSATKEMMRIIAEYSPHMRWCWRPTIRQPYAPLMQSSCCIYKGVRVTLLFRLQLEIARWPWCVIWG
jgi:hypothetical protein